MKTNEKIGNVNNKKIMNQSVKCYNVNYTIMNTNKIQT